MSNIAKIVYKAKHLERHQKAARAHLGLLEKKNDRRLRQKNYQDKEEVLKRLRDRAAERNKEEFHTRMTRAEMDAQGRIVQRKLDAADVSAAERKLRQRAERLSLKIDAEYVRFREAADRARAERLRETQQGLDEAADAVRRHVVLVDSDDEQSNASGTGGGRRCRGTGGVAPFNLAKHWDTHESLLEGGVANRMKTAQLRRGVVASREEGAMTELHERAARLVQLRGLADRLDFCERMKQGGRQRHKVMGKVTDMLKRQK